MLHVPLTSLTIVAEDLIREKLPSQIFIAVIQDLVVFRPHFHVTGVRAHPANIWNQHRFRMAASCSVVNLAGSGEQIVQPTRAVM